MSVAGAGRPPADGEAEVTAGRSGVAVSARVEAAGDATVVVRPSAGAFVEQAVVRVGEPVHVFWRDGEDCFVLPAEVGAVERGATPRWHLLVTGPAAPSQRRDAVRARTGLALAVTLAGSELAGELLDLSEAGARVGLDGLGEPPEAGTSLQVTVPLDGGPVTVRAEVVRARTRGARWLLSLRFVGLAEREQDRLRRHVFQVLREERVRASG